MNYSNSGRAFIFGMHNPCDKSFPMLPCLDLFVFKVKLLASVGDYNSLNLLVLEYL